jgi:hypothetical protein
MMGLKEIITGLVKSKSNGFQGQLQNGQVIVEEEWVKKLHNYLKDMEGYDKAVQEKETLEKLREEIAQECFEEDDLGGLTCEESDGWEKDGNYLNKKFYYKDDENPDGDSKVATFVVVFKEGTAELIDGHVNAW